MDNTAPAQPADRARQGRHGRRGAGRGRLDPARGVLLPEIPSWSARCARCGPATSASSSRSRRRWWPAARRRRPSAGSRPPASRSSPRAPRATTATAAAARRTTCSCDLPRARHDGRRSKDAVPADYLPWGHEKDLPQGQPATGSPRRSPAGTPRTGPTQRRQVHQREHLRRRRRRVPGRHRAGAAGARSATPATSTRPATRCRRRSSPARARRCSSTTAGVVRGTWTKKSLTSPLKLSHQGRRADRAGRAHLDRAGAAERRQRHRHEVSRCTGVLDAAPVAAAGCGRRMSASGLGGRRG